VAAHQRVQRPGGGVVEGQILNQNGIAGDETDKIGPQKVAHGLVICQSFAFGTLFCPLGFGSEFGGGRGIPHFSVVRAARFDQFVPLYIGEFCTADGFPDVTCAVNRAFSRQGNVGTISCGNGSLAAVGFLPFPGRGDDGVNISVV
jgi:hypothetical protein